MPHGTQALEFCRRALVMLGARPIDDFAEMTAEARVAAELYPGLRDAVISAHPWSFATRQARLEAVEEQPLADFDFAYALPEDCLRVLSAGQGGRGRGAEFLLRGGRLHADTLEPVLTYVARVPEAVFPAYFAQALILRIAAEFCLRVMEAVSRAEMLSRLAEREFARAKSVDAQQDAPPRFEGFPLLGVRGR